jgi:dsRNA-specific ribonuclease
MANFKPTERQERLEDHAGFRFRVVSFRFGDRFRATADNVDPGATLARAEGQTREEAEAQVAEKARRKLGRTRTFEP